MSSPVDEKAILPFNPPGTFPPGTFAPGSSAPGVVTVLAPSYPLLPAGTGAGQPMSIADVQQQQLYPQAAFPPQAVVAHPRSASMPLMGDPLTPTSQTYSVTTFYTGDGVPVHSRASTVPAGTQHLMTVPQQAITTEPRYSIAGGFASPTDPNYGDLSPRPMSGHVQSPTWGTTGPPIQTNIPMQATQPMSFLPPQAGVSPDSVAAPPPPYKDDKVPPLTTQPKFNWQGNGNIFSRDDLLNRDGDALYRFILDHMDLPTLQLHCYGSHIVTSITASGGKVQTKETTVVDFDFVIDLALSMNRGSGELYILDDNIFAYRGRMEKEVGGRADEPRTVWDWARNYAESPKTGKEFRFSKTISGLDRPKVVDAINQIINSTGHSTYRNVYFTVGNSHMTVRANSDLMTMLNHECLSCLLWIVCAYPFIWLYRRFGEAGGKWDVCRAAYACVRDPRDPVGVVNGTPLGDGDWVKIWERTIRLGVGNRIQSSRPIYRPTANDSGVIVFD